MMRPLPGLPLLAAFIYLPEQYKSVQIVGECGSSSPLRSGQLCIDLFSKTLENISPFSFQIIIRHMGNIFFNPSSCHGRWITNEKLPSRSLTTGWLLLTQWLVKGRFPSVVVLPLTLRKHGLEKLPGVRHTALAWFWSLLLQPREPKDPFLVSQCFCSVCFS